MNDKDKSELELIMQHPVKDIIREILPFIRYGGGASALTAIRHALDPKWHDSLDAYTFAISRLSDLTRFTHEELVHTREGNWIPESDDIISFHECNLCKSIIREDSRADHFRRCESFIKTAEMSNSMDEFEVAITTLLKGEK